MSSAARVLLWAAICWIGALHSSEAVLERSDADSLEEQVCVVDRECLFGGRQLPECRGHRGLEVGPSIDGEGLVVGGGSQVEPGGREVLRAAVSWARSWRLRPWA